MSASPSSLCKELSALSFSTSNAPKERCSADGKLEIFQSLSAIGGYTTLSPEELRLMDYKNGRKPVAKLPAVDWMPQSVTTIAPQKQHISMDNNLLELLCGPGIEVVVGSCDDSQKSWTLPQKLLSHHSPFMKAACERDFKERDENKIKLPTDEAQIFALFVEWMYYGTYKAPHEDEEGNRSTLHISTHAKCWVLGDKLLCSPFKTYAMSWIHCQHSTLFTYKPMTIADVRFVCEHSGRGSKLRTYYFDYIAAHFSSASRLSGAAEEWDELCLEFGDLRLHLFTIFRSPPEAGQDGWRELSNYTEEIVDEATSENKKSNQKKQ